MSSIDGNKLGFGKVAGRLCAAAPLLLGLALAGCAVQRAEVDEGYSEAALTAQGGGAGIPLQVDGAVGSVHGQALAASVAGGMPTDIGGTAVHYAPCEPYEECPGDHIVWTFGPPAVRPASDYPSELHLNVDWIGSYRPSPGNVTAKVALFQGGNVVATAEGQVDASNGTEDPAFRAMIAAMSRAVFAGPDCLD
jgi:hypothetical protein